MHVFTRLLRLVLLSSLSVWLGASAWAARAQVSAAAIFVVNTLTDASDANLSDSACDIDSGQPGPQCTLRAAIQQANATAGLDTIVVSQGTYTLNPGFGGLIITDSVDLYGDIGAAVTVDGGNATRVFDVQAGVSVLLQGLTIRNGTANGVRNFGTLTLTSTAIINNGGSGIFNSGTLRVANSTISTNGGSGLFNAATGAAQLSSVTVANNTSDTASGIDSVTGGTVTLRNSIVAGNKDSLNNPRDCSGTLTLAGYNLIQNPATCSVGGNTTGFLANIDPLLGPLQNNGGPSHTHALLAASPARNAGNPTACTDHAGTTLLFDQRGSPAARSQAGRCDLGAYELAAVSVSPATVTVNEASGSVAVSATLAVASPVTVTVNVATSNGTALAGVDYGAVSTVLTIPPLSGQAGVNVPIINNGIFAPPRSFMVALSSPTGAALMSPTLSTVTITDDEIPLVFLPAIFRDYAMAYLLPCETEINDAFNQANGPIVSGRGYCGTNAAREDRDYFSFTADNGAITLNTTGLTNGAQVHLYYQNTNNRVGFSASPPYQVTHNGSAGLYYAMIFTPQVYTGGQYSLTAIYP
ncbi:MAG: choice-of-anchor Q domain-containing protein [Anaerolineales bacterium]